MPTLLPSVVRGFLVIALFGSPLPVRAADTPAAPMTLSRPVGGLDVIGFGSDESEQSHDLKADRSETLQGALGERARRLLAGEAKSWEGGKAAFTMKVSSEAQNYFTARFWGDEPNPNLLVLFCDGKQVGYRHLGDVDVLALADDEPRYNGRFYYVTTPLPRAITRGKTEIRLEIRATGGIWSYGVNFDQYQRPMTTPARGMYRGYTHTGGSFIPPPDEKQGDAPPATKRSSPGPEVLAEAKDRVNKSLVSLLKTKRPLNQMEVQFLAKAYSVKWTAAYRQKAAIDQVVKGVDELYARLKKDPAELWKDKATWNPEWFGVGPAGDAVRQLAEPLGPSLDAKVDGDKTRRAAWSELFQASRDHLRTHRRWLANQAMFTDVNLYLSNRAVAAIDPGRALPEEKAKDYLYQAVGLVPWLGSDTDQGPEKQFGDDFRQVTAKGLTRELGYVGGYGEVGVGGATEIYQATREPGGEGDPRLKAQLAKMVRARGPFRYPMLDEENHPAMRLETAVGWRDSHSPGYVAYVEPPTGEGSSLRQAALTLDPYAVGYAQQMFADNQFFASVATQLKEKRFRNTVGLLDLPDEYELIQAQPASPHRLPMTPDQPDFVFADEEDGVVAVKNGQEILYASLYWRAGFAVNSLARVHYLTPAYQQTATVREEAAFETDGLTFKRPDWINFGFAKGGTHIHYPRDLHQALAGEELPIVRIPAGVKFTVGDWNQFAGRADFYTLRFGRYLIGMNTTTARTFDLKVPAGEKPVRELVSKRTDVAAGSVEKVGPRSTVVLYLAE